MVGWYLCVSPQILAEYRDPLLVLKRKEKNNCSTIERINFRNCFFCFQSRNILPKENLNICLHDEDNMPLACSLEAKAHFLITGDRDLIQIPEDRIKKYLPCLKIISPSEFIIPWLIQSI